LNILVTHNWECRVCDFGLSRFNTTESVETLKQMRGTFTHMAPELCQTGDEDRTDPDKYKYTDKSDVYSMGIVFWEMVKRCVDSSYSKPWFSEFPSLGGPGMEVMIILKAQQGIRPSLKVSEEPAPGCVPPHIDQFYKRSVLQDRDGRPNAEEFLAAIQELEKEYNENKDKWNAYRKPAPSGKVQEPTLILNDDTSAKDQTTTAAVDTPKSTESSS